MVITMKKVLIAIVSALLVCSPAMAKVTYDDAAKHDRELRAKVPKPNQRSTFSSSQIAGQTGSTNGWRLLYRGKTTGAISVPSTYSDVFVKLSNGDSMTFPRSSSGFSLSTGVAQATWTGSSVNGRYMQRHEPYDCRGGEHTCYHYVTYQIHVLEVMAK